MFGGYLRGVWKVSERCLEGIWKVSERCLEGIWKVSERCRYKTINTDSSLAPGLLLFRNCRTLLRRCAIVL